MKLILGSDLIFLLKYGYNLTGISKDQMRIGYVNTAVKGRDEKTKLFMENVKNKIRENGYNFEEIDIEGKTIEELKEFFKDKNAIHIDGGSTFYLLNAMKESNFDNLLVELLTQGKVFIGTSAGAAIMGPTIRSSSGIPENPTEEMLKGLNLMPYMIQAHYTDDKKDEYKEKIKDLQVPVKIFRDGQGMFCEDGVCKFVGDGEEVKLN